MTQTYHSPPGSGSSTPLYDLAEFDLANSSVARSELDVASVVPSDISPIVARFMPLNPQESQVSHLSSVQLSPNRVRSNFEIDTVDLDPLFTMSPRSAGDLLLISSPDSPLSCALSDVHSWTNKASASVDSGRESPATSMSINNRTGELQLMMPPLIPLPEMINIQTDPALLQQLTQAYREWLPQPPPVPTADPQPVLSREGPFDALAETTVTRGHPLISDQRDGCPYRVTCYRDDDQSNLDSPFGVQVRHPRFLEWVGAPE